MSTSLNQGAVTLELPVVTDMRVAIVTAEWNSNITEAMTADAEKDIRQVHRFVEKPKHELAEQLLTEGALWNGGVFAFRLGYITSILDKYVSAPSFAEVRSRYQEFPKISFDYEVAERAESVAVIPFTGQWKDLGTWNALTEELPNQTIGKVVLDPEAKNTHVVNELSMPLICLGTDNLVVAASSDGILVADKAHSEELKTHLAKLGPDARPMYEERRWGEYKVIDHIEFPDGQKVLTKQLCIKAGKNISYQVHHQREEVWTIINGTGRVVLSGEERMAMSLCSLLGMFSFSLAGFSFPVTAMDSVLQYAAMVLPLRHYYLLYVNQALNGFSIAYAWPSLLALALLVLLPLLLLKRYRHLFLYQKYTP